MINCGIYIIRNTVNGKCYIGSSNNILKRWNRHKSVLNRNKHENKYLQNAWNKYGKEVFVFEVVEEIPIEHVKYIEQQYLDNAKLMSFMYYNICWDVTHPSGMAGKKHSEESKKKISANSAQKGKKGTMSGKYLTNEQRLKVSLSLMGTKRRLDKTVYSFKNIVTNELFTGIRYDFIKKYNLCDSKISSLIYNKRNIHKNWILIK